MTRELTSHKVNGCNESLRIEVLDEIGSGGAHHLYQITGFNSESNVSNPWVDRPRSIPEYSTILFQNGPIQEVGVNGLTHEALLAIVIDRLQCFQAGQYACRENAIALTKLEEAVMWLKKRTSDRIARGVEGTHVK